MTDSFLHSVVVMDTVVTFRVIGGETEERRAAVARAAGWFHAINDDCTRFDPGSELGRLSTHVGMAVPVSVLLFQAIQFALSVAEESDGAFDPTVGLQLERRGFNREYRTGTLTRTNITHSATVSYRDVCLDRAARTVTFRRPLLLDLGAVAKGLAIDMAALELRPFRDFAIDAGGDLYLGGRNGDGRKWAVGIRHPRDEEAVIATLMLSDMAVCTSGDYERRSATDNGHHLLDARTGAAAALLASATVVASSAILADALSTAAFALGPVDGLALLERHDVDGLLITPALEQFATPGMSRRYGLRPA